MKAFFVTGTDTEVGKTTVSASVLLAAQARGLRAACMKPLESGCVKNEGGRLMPADALRLWNVCGAWQDFDTVNMYAFEEAVAPGVAAHRLGVSVDFDRIETRWMELQSQSPDFVLIEGAGGWLVPVGAGLMIADLAVVFALPVLVVARPGLGTINHTLLTVEAIRRRGLKVAGVILSDARGDADARFARANARSIESAGKVRVLGLLRHLPGHGAASGPMAEADLTLDVLFE